MEWIAGNWLLLLVLGGCVGMHLLMHRNGHHKHNVHTDDSQRMQYSMATDTIKEIPHHDDDLGSKNNRKTGGHNSEGCCSHSTH